MGNSGSMNGLPGYDDATAYHHPGYHHQYQRYHEMMRANGGNSGGPAPAWLESYQRDLRNGRSTFDNRHHHHDSGTHRDSTVSSGPSLPPPMKVLPDIPGRVAKLRPTNNGNILHSGGTISKNNNLQRSKSISSPTYQQHQKQSSFDEAEENGGPLNSLPPRMAMMRSKTQFNMMAGGRPRDFDDSRRGYATNQRKPSYEHGTLNKKRFGSEPDLRLSMAAELQQEQEAGPAGHRNTKPVQSKIMKGKNKKKAPVPPAADKREPEPIEKHQPQLQQQQQRIIAYSPLRKTNSDASSTLPSSDSNSNNPTRKLRLFKTRAETKKNIITKLPEASDAKYQAKPAASSNGQMKMRVSPTNSGTQPYKPPRKDPDFDTSTLDKPKSRLNPTSFFRREKTFDLGILERDRLAQQPEVKPTMSPPISRRKSIVKSLLEKDQKEQQQLRQQEQQSRIASVEPKFKPKVQDEKRKSSQPQAAATTPVMTDFQKELAMATRRKTALGGSNPNLAQTKPAPTGAANQQRKMSEVTKQTIKVEPAPPPTQTKNNSLVISVEPPKQDDREKLSISPPPPPPPLPKTSFYFGMTAPKKTPEPKISPTLLVKAKMLETRVDTEPESSSEEDEAKRPLESPSDDSEMDKTQLDVIDRFAASLLNGTKFQSGSDSAASSEVDVRTTSGIELFTEGQEISLKLRPTLPRKNFEIPRFSPAAAWRLLTTEDDFGRDSTELFPFADQKKTQLLRSLEAVDAAAEDRIERIYREPIPGLQDNKSGDSGISGDAGLPDLGEAQMMNSSKERDSPESSPVDDGGVGVGVGGTNGWSASAIRLTPWTPQQDLEDDDDTTGSSADNRQLIEESPLSGGPNDFSSKGHLFSLSLPRENHLSIYTGTAANGEKVEKHMFNSLQKLRKSVSDAFTSDAELSPLESGDNWFLSRLDSSPPAITNAYEKRQLSPTGPKQTPPEAPSSAGSAGSKKNDSNEQFAAKPTKHLPIGYLISGKHMMYLPKEATKVVVTSGKNDANNNSLPTEVSPPLATMSSYQPRSGYGADRRRDNKENMQDPVPDGGENGGAGEMEKFPVKISNRKNHRFTFQSTIRQIEKRRVAEKLSREAEIKEAMRLSELEAMRRVEEEFQKKRAREKASIRHQLRLFSMEEGGNGQAFEGNEDDELPELIKRAEPEGDSMPHQPSSTTATNGTTKTNGMFRKRDATLERQTYLNGGGQARRLSQSRFHQTSTLERKYNQELDQDFNHDQDENDSDDDDVDSSLGYIDTRTPYISRIIQAKSSKSSYGGGLKK
ncbi:uncharacterized protein LOC120430698 [Culex pipiens pallens]|uniref:uncharacterized protein LOC120430698 n=1 Tax=Culex pipiens pallens TaxID=42434 RepID=UPI001954FE3E|nr:uncharacterized protein LOC120430698 [Culex pipiens pallens]